MDVCASLNFNSQKATPAVVPWHPIYINTKEEQHGTGEEGDCEMGKSRISYETRKTWRREKEGIKRNTGKNRVHWKAIPFSFLSYFFLLSLKWRTWSVRRRIYFILCLALLYSHWQRHCHLDKLLRGFWTFRSTILTSISHINFTNGFSVIVQRVG